MKKTVEEVKNELLNYLDLDGRSIIFHVYEINGDLLVGSGIVGDINDFEGTDRFYNYCNDNYDEPEFEVFDIITYCLGEGESDHADSEECANIEGMLCSPNKREALLRYFDEEAECINEVRHLRCTNEYYEPEEEEEEYDDEDDEDDEDEEEEW